MSRTRAEAMIRLVPAMCFRVLEEEPYDLSCALY